MYLNQPFYKNRMHQKVNFKGILTDFVGLFGEDQLMCIGIFLFVSPIG